MSTIYNVIFTASHNPKLLPHDNNAGVIASARLTSSQIDSKLDVHQRNNYNRTNHRLQHSPQIVVADDVDYTQSNDPYWNNGSRGLPGTPASQIASNVNNTISQRISSQSRSQSGSLSAGTSLDDANAYSIDSRRYTERRKKTVRFDGQESNDWTRWESERQNSQDSTTRDSGIDTSSTFTSSEDSNRGDGLKVFKHSPHSNPLTFSVTISLSVCFVCLSISMCSCFVYSFPIYALLFSERFFPSIFVFLLYF